MKFLRVCFAAAAVAASLPFSLFATDHHVGPGQALAEPGLVPWESLNAGDTVFIHWRAAPYAAKWVLCRQGTSAAPISIRGVRGPAGELPVVTGENATTRNTLNYWNRNRGIIKIGGASVPADTMPQYIVIDSLDLRSARPPYAFTPPGGGSESYINNAASVYVEKVRHLVVRDCVLSDSGNGLFISPDSEDVLIERCYLHSNGNVGSGFEHNAYTESTGIVYQFNRFGPLRAGCGGNNLKDRSAGLVVRYNWIEGGNRQLDLVDAEGSTAISSHPSYRAAFVYGNLLVEPDDGNRQIIHYGGDSGNTAIYRKGTLYLHHNTIVSTRATRTTLLRLSTNDESCDARNNLIFTTAGSGNLEMIDDTGTLTLTANWLRSGWVHSFNAAHTGVVIDGGGNLTGAAPGFLAQAAQDFHLTETSPCRNAGAALSVVAAASHPATNEYLRHFRSWKRSTADTLPDIGAYEFTPYAVWRNAQFGAGADALSTALPEADPDNDGSTNLDEFAASTAPLEGKSRPTPLPVLITIADGPHAAIAFPRRASPHGLSYQVQTSFDLTNWLTTWTLTDSGVQPTSVFIDEGSGTNSLVRDPAPLWANEFLRLRVELR